MVKLKELRLNKGATLKDVSTILGYKYPAGYHKIERGKQKLTVEQSKILAEYYDLEVSVFLDTYYSQ